MKDESQELAIAELCHQLRLPGAYRAYQELAQDPKSSRLSFTNRLGIILQREVDERKRKRVERLLKNSQIKDPMVSIDVITYEKQRKLDESLVKELATCSWILQEEPINLIITGKCGTGKTWLAKALGKQACALSIPTFFIRTSDFVEMVDEARERKNLGSLKKKLNGYKLLIIDDFAMTNTLSDENRDFFLSLLDERTHKASVIITSQRHWDSWYDWIGKSYETDAILDRLKYTSHFIHLEGNSMREKWKRK